MSPLGSDNTEELPGLATELAGRRSLRNVRSGSSLAQARTSARSATRTRTIMRSCESAEPSMLLRSNLPEGDLPERVEDHGFAMVVADGMGGMVGGERASILAIQTGIRLVLESPRWALRIDEQETRQLIERLRAYFHEVDATLIRVTEVDPSLFGMGTTLTVAYSVGNHAFFVHAGDSEPISCGAASCGSLPETTRLPRPSPTSGGSHPSRSATIPPAMSWSITRAGRAGGSSRRSAPIDLRKRRSALALHRRSDRDARR